MDIRCDSKILRGSLAITFSTLIKQDTTCHVLWSLASCDSLTVVYARCTGMLSC